MSGTQITEIDTPLVGDPGMPASSSDPGTAGDDAPAVSEPAGTPFNDQDFSAATILTLDPRVTGGAGGNGAAGASGTDGTATTVYSQLPNLQELTTITYVTPGTGGGDGGGGGAGGDAALAMSGDSVGAIGASFANSRFILDAEMTGGVGGNGNAGGQGGGGGANVNTTNLVESGTSGGDGGNGGNAGNGGAANGEVSGLTSYVQDGTALTVEAIGGAGGPAAGNASISGNEGGNAGDPTGGGNGGNGGDGAAATATLAATVAADDTQLGVELNVIGGTGAAGGAGGPGGDAGFATDTSEPFNTYRYGANGNGGDGGNGGDASAILTGNALTAPSVGINLFAEGGAGGAGGMGANESSLLSTPSTQYDVSPPGATGATGASDPTIVFTDNVVTVGAGVPGDKLASALQMLTLNLEEATQNSGGTGFTLDSLNGASGGNLVFSGNDFVGAGASTLNLNIAGNGTVTVNTLTNTISIDGSPGNTMTGFSNFSLDNNDTFIVGGQSYVVSYASDPDTLVYTPQSHDVTVQNVTADNLLLDFSGFGAALDPTSLQTDTTTGGGNTYITIPDAGLIELAGFTGAIPSGDISFVAACYCAGTRIATPRGDIAVEDLAVGEMVRARFAGLAAIRWIGRRQIDCRRHPEPGKVWPVRVRAGAFGAGAPRRDLWLSPDHAVFVEDVLIPIKHLINGTSIEQVPVDGVTYYHVALAEHDVLLAERLPAESYLDSGDRTNFTNGGGSVVLHPDLSTRVWEAIGCAPLIVTGPELNAARRRVRAAAAAFERQAAAACAVA